MTRPEWVEVNEDTWAANLGNAVLYVRRLPGTDEWTWQVLFPDSREIKATRPYLTRGNAQAGAQHAAVRDA